MWTRNSFSSENVALDAIKGKKYLEYDECVTFNEANYGESGDSGNQMFSMLWQNTQF